MSSMVRNCWPLLSKKTTVVNGSMHYGQACISRMLMGNTRVAGTNAAVWRPIARSCGVVVPSNSSMFGSKRDAIGM
jgi:hypothetical protein